MQLSKILSLSDNFHYDRSSNFVVVVGGDDGGGGGGVKVNSVDIVCFVVVFVDVVVGDGVDIGADSGCFVVVLLMLLLLVVVMVLLLVQIVVILFMLLLLSVEV